MKMTVEIIADKVLGDLLAGVESLPSIVHRQLSIVLFYDIKGESQYQTTAAVHSDNPAAEFFDWRTVNVYFHRFADAVADENGEEESPNFWCFGHEWNLMIKWLSDEQIAVYLNHCSDSSTHMYFSIGVRSVQKFHLINARKAHFFHASKSKLVGNIKTNKAEACLIGGALLLEIHMQRPSNYQQPPFIPDNPSACKNVQAMFMDEETADVVFEVGGKHVKDDSGTKQIKIEPSLFYAHRAILKNAAPVLANMCKSGGRTENVIQLSDVSPEIFNHLIEYIYGRESADFGSDMERAKEVIKAADKYGVSYLKLKAESYYVSSIKLTFDNVMEHLHYADSMNCALLKEAVMDFIAARKGEIVERKILEDAPGGIINDILVAMMRLENKRSAGCTEDEDLNSMGLSALRRKAFERGLEIDGSREMLISSLQHLELNSTNS